MTKRLENIYDSENFAIHEIVMPLFEQKRSETVIDLGAGKGTTTALLKRLGLNVKACDSNPALFRPGDIEIKKVNLDEKLPYASNQFDNALAIEVVEHLENPWLFFREVYRIMKKGGTLVISTPNTNSINSRVRYLLFGTLPYFSEHAYRNIYHVSPIFIWNLRRMIENKFKIKRIFYKNHAIPFTRIMIPFKNALFGEVIIFELERI